MRNHERSCVGCIHNDGVAVVVVGDEPCWTCLHSTVDLPNYEEELPQKRLATNANRIRSMTDEELAELLASTDGDFPPNCEGVPVRKLEAYWLDWLRQEAEEGEK